MDTRIPDKKRGFILLATLQQFLRVFPKLKPAIEQDPMFRSIQRLVLLVWGRSHYFDNRAESWAQYVSVLSDFNRVFTNFLHECRQRDRAWITNPVVVEFPTYIQVSCSSLALFSDIITDISVDGEK